MAKNRRLMSLERLEPRWLTHAGALPWPESEAAAAMPDFALTDVNPASTTSGRPVSPRDYLQQVSGWYFTHAT